MEREIDSTRETYRPGAFSVSIMYFCINDLSGIDPMYQYSLQWFENLFQVSLQKAKSHTKISRRLDNIKLHFTYFLFENVCSSLFGKHKLIFSFLLCSRILQSQGKISQAKFDYFLKGPVMNDKAPPIPEDFSYFADNQWENVYQQIRGLEVFSSFKGIYKRIGDNYAFWNVF